MTAKKKQGSRAFRAVNDVYEFDGWKRAWLKATWLCVTFGIIALMYPTQTGYYIPEVMRMFTAYELEPGITSDARTVETYADALSHAVGFLTTHINKSFASGAPREAVMITDYNQVLFARLELDFRTNCDRAMMEKGSLCYRSGLDPTNGAPVDPEKMADLTAGPNGIHNVVLLDKGFSRNQTLEAVARVLGDQLPYITAYAYEARLRLGVFNSLGDYYRVAYSFTITRYYPGSSNRAVNPIRVQVDNLPVRSLPLYVVYGDYVRLATELACLVLFAMAIWDEVVQFNVCWAWAEMHSPDQVGAQRKPAWRRFMHTSWLFFAEPWNVLDAIALVNFAAWTIAYIVIIIQSYFSKVQVMETTSDFDAMRSYAKLRFDHMVWFVFSSTLIGVRILSEFKTHSGLRIYAVTMTKSIEYFKDLLMFFGGVWLLIFVLVTPLFIITGSNAAFVDGQSGLLNIALIAFSLFGYQDYFANDSPTFGQYQVVFMLAFWFTVIMLVVISQNVMLALVAAAYDEARESEGTQERSFMGLTWYRLCWIVYSRWHRWVLRKSRYVLARELMANIKNADSWSYDYIFVRWALSCTPEARLLARLYTDPASEVLYLYSPWAWSRASPWDHAQLAPWDEQLCYPMYTWGSLPTNGPGVRPRLRRLPPLFTSKGGPEDAARLPVLYNDADDIFALDEDEVDDLLDCVEAAWQRMRRNAVVGRCSELGWSEPGRALLREGLLQVYCRHSTHERTTSSIQGPTGAPGRGSGGEQAAAAAPAGDGEVDPHGVLHVKSTAALPELPSKRGDDAIGGPLTGHSHYAAAAGDPAHAAATPPRTEYQQQRRQRRQHEEERGRQLHFFNRRGRIADSLDLLWNQQSKIRAQQERLEAMLQALLLELRQQRGVGGAAFGGAVGPGLGSDFDEPAGGRGPDPLTRPR